MDTSKKALSTEELKKIATELPTNRNNVETRNKQMVTFNAYRVGLPHSRTDWGTKIFFGACIAIGVLEKTNGRYRPTDDMVKTHDGMFIEIDGDWGIANQMEFTDKLFPLIVAKANHLRELFKEQKNIKANAQRIMREAERAMQEAVGGE